MLFFIQSQFIVSFFTNFCEHHLIVVVNLLMHLTKFLLADYTRWSYKGGLDFVLALLEDQVLTFITAVLIKWRNGCELILFNLALKFLLRKKLLCSLISFWRSKSAIAHFARILLVVYERLVVHLSPGRFIQIWATMVRWFVTNIVLTTLIFFKLFSFINLTLSKILILIHQIMSLSCLRCAWPYLWSISTSGFRISLIKSLVRKFPFSVWSLIKHFFRYILRIIIV